MSQDQGSGSAALARVPNHNGMLAATETAMGDRSLTTTNAHTHAMTARQEAEIKAQYTMALARPRDLDTVRLKLMSRCGAKRFAEVARYKKPQGKKQNSQGQWVQNFIEGWSIRFVEEAIRCLGNIKPETRVTADDSERMMVWVCVTDMESNIPYADEIVVNKTVERKELKKNQMPLAVRTNSYGDPVYILPATDDEVRMAKARLVSMTLRTLGLRLLPGDILDECLEIVLETQRKDVDADPSAARKRLVDAFAKVGIRPVDIVEYLGGRPLDALTPDLIIELRGIYQLVDEGARWTDILVSSPYIDREEGDEPKEGSAAAKLRAKLESNVGALVEKDKATAARRAAVERIAESVGVDTKQINTVLQLINGGKTVENIARYSRDQTGIEDEVIVKEIVSRATTANLLRAKPAATDDKAPETPKAAQPAASPPAATQAAPKRSAKANPKHVAIAKETDVSVELVEAIEPFVGGDDPDATVAAALKLKGHSVDEPTVGIVRAAFRK